MAKFLIECSYCGDLREMTLWTTNLHESDKECPKCGDKHPKLREIKKVDYYEE